MLKNRWQFQIYRPVIGRNPAGGLPAPDQAATLLGPNLSSQVLRRRRYLIASLTLS